MEPDSGSDTVLLSSQCEDTDDDSKQEGMPVPFTFLSVKLRLR